MLCLWERRQFDCHHLERVCYMNKLGHTGDFNAAKYELVNDRDTFKFNESCALNSTFNDQRHG